MDNEGSLNAERAQRLGDRPQQFGFGDAEQLHLRPRRVQARAEQVHDRANLQRSAHRAGVGDARMIERREQEAEAGPVENLARIRAGSGQASRRAPRGRRPSRIGGEGTVAVLDHRQSAGGCDKRRRGRDVDRAGTIAAGAATVGKEIIGRGKARAAERSAARRRSARRPSRRCMRKATKAAAISGSVEPAIDDRLEKARRPRPVEVMAVEEAGHRLLGAGTRGAAQVRRTAAERSKFGSLSSPETKKPAGRRAGSR